MVLLQSDYLEGACPEVLARLAATNEQQTPGYGEDTYCEEARDMIRSICQAPDAAVHFLVGGTQANRTVLASILRPHQGVLSADSGHIAAHETGAIENSGHKVLTLPSTAGKITGAQVEKYCAAHFADSSFEHMVQPGAVYISNPTEIGTIYTHSELEELYGSCRKWNLPLYIDGARLGCALYCEENDYTLSEMAQLCDVFTIGGTKMGALFGEAVVIMNPRLQPDFRYYIKQNGGMFAKGRLLGLQFLALLEDGLYERVARHELELAMQLKRGLLAKGYEFYVDSPTNQQFPIFSLETAKKIQEDFCYSLIEDRGETQVVRFCTSWCTRPEDIDALLAKL